MHMFNFTVFSTVMFLYMNSAFATLLATVTLIEFNLHFILFLFLDAKFNIRLILFY